MVGGRELQREVCVCVCVSGSYFLVVRCGALSDREWMELEYFGKVVKKKRPTEERGRCGWDV